MARLRAFQQIYLPSPKVTLHSKPKPKKMNTEIQDRITEIKEALQALCLGSIEHVVIEAAVNELIQNWEDHK